MKILTTIFLICGGAFAALAEDSPPADAATNAVAISTDLINRLVAEARTNNPFTHVQSYAMGWVLQDYRGEMLVSHGGALNGFRTAVALLPDRNAGVVVLANVGRGFGVTALRNTLLDILLGAPSHDWNNAYLGIEKRACPLERGDSHG